MTQNVRSIEYKGVTVEYDAACLKSWKWQKAVFSGDATRAMGAIERLLMGKDEEYADALGDEFDVMQELVAAVIEDSGVAAKN